MMRNVSIKNMLFVIKVCKAGCLKGCYHFKSGTDCFSIALFLNSPM